MSRTFRMPDWDMVWEKFQEEFYGRLPEDGVVVEKIYIPIDYYQPTEAVRVAVRFDNEGTLFYLDLRESDWKVIWASRAHHRDSLYPPDTGTTT